MQERRTADRWPAFLRGSICFNRRQSAIDCIVKNVSPAGAKLLLYSAVAVPRQFDLVIPLRHAEYRARVVWRHLNEIGVTFERRDESADALRIRNLQREAARLRRRLATLERA